MRTLFSLLLAGGVGALALPTASAGDPLNVDGSAHEQQAVMEPFAAPTPAQKEGKEKAKPVAPAQVKSEVVVLLATNDGKGIDPKLGDLPELKKPPFSSYDSYTLVDRHELKLDKGKLQEQKLPDGGMLKVTYADLVAGEEGEPHRFVLSTAIHKPDGKAFLPTLNVKAEQGKYFFVAGQRYNKGVLVLGIRVMN